MSPDPRRRSERARHAILAATRELLSEVGYLRLTIEAVAARAGVGKQTIYRWWPSKGAVVFEAMLAGDEATVELPDTGDLVADLRSALRGAIEEMTEPSYDQLLRTIIAEVQHDPELAQELVDRLLRPQYDATIDRLRRAQEVGQLAPELDPAVVMESLYGAILHRWLQRTGGFDEGYVDRLLAVVLGAGR